MYKFYILEYVAWHRRNCRRPQNKWFRRRERDCESRWSQRDDWTLLYLSPKGEDTQGLSLSLVVEPLRDDTHEKKCFFSGLATKVLPFLH